MATYIQAERPLQVRTQLGDDKFMLAGIQGREAISVPFAFHLDLRSEDPAVDGAALLRTPVAVRIVGDPETPPREIYGMISRFVQLGRRDDLTAYYAEVVPWLWFLSLARDCRIFQDLSVLEIAQQVFQEMGFQPTQHFRIATTRAYAKREYCVQYRETHLDFVSRLLEEEGIFYFFEHADGKHVLTLADANNTAPVSPGTPTARMGVSDGVQGDAITSLRCEYSVHSGKVTLKDYDFLQPSLSLQGTISGTGPEEVYDYPGHFTTMDAGDRLARLQLEADEALELAVRCTSTYTGVQAGTRFDLEGHHRSDLNQNFLVLETDLAASAENLRGWEGTGFDYRNEFLAIPSKTPFRPQRRTPRPIMPGSQTAVVVGKPGEEVWVDKYGRVKVQFHWDRLGQKDDTSSCWVRVLTPWGGKGYGSVSIPRIGNEVIVSFIEGDPDRPIITGSVYNADQMPPYALPGSGIQMGMKSRSSKGGGGANEITMTDTKGKELINIHAQYNLNADIENNETRTIKAGTQTVTVKGDTSLTVQAGNRKVSVTGGNYEGTADQAVKLTGQSQGVQITGTGKGVTVDGAGGDGVKVTGNPKVDIAGSSQAILKAPEVSISGTARCGVVSPEVTVTGSSKLNLNSPQIDIGDNQVTIHGTTIVLQAGGNSITIDGSGVTINGAKISSLASGPNTIMGAVVMIN